MTGVGNTSRVRWARYTAGAIVVGFYVSLASSCLLVTTVDPNGDHVLTSTVRWRNTPLSGAWTTIQRLPAPNDNSLLACEQAAGYSPQPGGNQPNVTYTSEFEVAASGFQTVRSKVVFPYTTYTSTTGACAAAPADDTGANMKFGLFPSNSGWDAGIYRRCQRFADQSFWKDLFYCPDSGKNWFFFVNSEKHQNGITSSCGDQGTQFGKSFLPDFVASNGGSQGNASPVKLEWLQRSGEGGRYTVAIGLDFMGRTAPTAFQVTPAVPLRAASRRRRATHAGLAAHRPPTSPTPR